MAKITLSELNETAVAHEEVIMTEGGEPTVKIAPIVVRRFVIGLLKGELVGTGPDFLEPMNEDELARWEGNH